MPLILLIAGGAGGFILAKGTDAVGDVIKWGVIGGGGYLVAKHFKVI